ncbi:MAG: methionyl-tRNA formyltransferase [Woeseiaceae bacterium]
MTHPKILFAGTPDFALASLQALIASGVRPVAVLTQPDRPAGRGKRLTASPVKRLADELGIFVLQPARLGDSAVSNEIESLEPDLMIVVAYGLLLPQRVLDIPARGCVNVHASVLPRWRGAAPIPAAILAGDAQTGVSLMAMTAGLDSGPVYASATLAIGTRETASELHDRLADLGGRLLLRHLDAIVDGSLVAVPQDESCSTYAGKINTQDAVMDWSRPAIELQRLVLAFNAVPGAWFMLDDERIKCWEAEAVAGVNCAAGSVVSAGQDGIVVACGEGALRLTSLQRPGKRRVAARQLAAQIDMRDRRLG